MLEWSLSIVNLIIGAVTLSSVFIAGLKSYWSLRATIDQNAHDQTHSMRELQNSLTKMAREMETLAGRLISIENKVADLVTYDAVRKVQGENISRRVERLEGFHNHQDDKHE